MKRLLRFFLWAALLSVSFPGYAQLVLNPGDAWLYDFSNLPKTGSTPVFGTNPGGSFQFSINGSTFQNGDMLRYEMFENSSTEPPICSGTMSSAPPFDRTCSSDFSWQDRQGAIRLTMLSGSVEVDSITITAITSGPSLSSYDVNSVSFTPVPEPGAPALLATGCLTAFGIHRTWRRRRRSDG